MYVHRISVKNIKRFLNKYMQIVNFGLGQAFWESYASQLMHRSMD